MSLCSNNYLTPVGHSLFRMSGSRESLLLRLHAGACEQRPHGDYYLYGVFWYTVKLFGRIWIHYSAYYSDQIEYEQNIGYNFTSEFQLLVTQHIDSVISQEFLDTTTFLRLKPNSRCNNQIPVVILGVFQDNGHQKQAERWILLWDKWQRKMTFKQHHQ